MVECQHRRHVEFKSPALSLKRAPHYYHDASRGVIMVECQHRRHEVFKSGALILKRAPH